jgi:hypothetical protein
MSNNITFDSEKDNIQDKLVEVLSANTNKVLLFNKVSGAYISMIVSNDTSGLDDTYYKWKIMQFDASTHEWYGDYDNGKLIAKDDLPTAIYEENVDDQAGAVIKESYPWFSQINILTNLLKKVIEDNNISGEEVEKFNQMNSFIEARRDANRRYKDAYIAEDSFEFKTRRDVWNEQAKRLDGGLHELLGPEDKFNSLPHLDPDNDVDQPGEHY